MPTSEATGMLIQVSIVKLPVPSWGEFQGGMTAAHWFIPLKFSPFATLPGTWAGALSSRAFAPKTTSLATMPLVSSSGHQWVMPVGAVTQVAVRVAVAVAVRVAVPVAVLVAVRVGVKVGLGVDVRVAVAVAVRVGVNVGLGVDVSDGLAVNVGVNVGSDGTLVSVFVAVAVAVSHWPVGSPHNVAVGEGQPPVLGEQGVLVAVDVPQICPGSQVAVEVAQGSPASQVWVGEAHGPLEHGVDVGLAVTLSQGMPASQVGVGEGHWPLLHAVAVGVAVPVSVAQGIPASHVGVGEGQRPSAVEHGVLVTVAVSHTCPGSQVGVAEGQPTAGLAHGVPVAVAVSVGSVLQGSGMQRVGVAVALPSPFGRTTFSTGTADMPPAGAAIAATTATVLSKVTSITTISAKYWKYRFRSIRSVFILCPSLHNRQARTRLVTVERPPTQHGCQERRELNEDMAMQRSIQLKNCSTPAIPRQ